MKRIKIVYTKGEAVKYLGFRDLMRTIQRAVRRADIPMIYSQGFNPHMKISWGQAIKVGAISEGEEAILQVEAWVRPQEVMEKLNKTLPPGIAIIEANLV
ncbi:MAG: TIGR03936 family radical SAM-associated protein [bacterium]